MIEHVTQNFSSSSPILMGRKVTYQAGNSGVPLLRRNILKCKTLWATKGEIRCFALRLSTLLLSPAKRNIQRHGLALIHRNRSVLLCEAIQTEGHGVSPSGHLDSRGGDPSSRAPVQEDFRAARRCADVRPGDVHYGLRQVHVQRGQRVVL